MNVKNITDLQGYLNGMFNGRPGDQHPRFNHSRLISTTVLALAGAVIWVADKDSIVIREQSGRATNVCWFNVRGNRHALVYRNGEVHLHQRSQAGPAVEVFTDQNADRIGPVFATL